MQKEEAIKKARIVFWAQATMAATLAALFQTGYIIKETLNLAPTTRYITEVAGVMLTIMLIPLAIKAFTKQMQRAAKEKTNHFIEYYHNKCNARTTILFAVVMMNIALYYALDNNSSFYCTLLGIAAAIYSYPTRAIIDKYCNNQEREE